MYEESKNILNNFFLIHELDFSDEDLYILEMGHSFPEFNKQIGPRVRDSYIIHFVISGEGSFCNNPVIAGNGFLICPNQLHTFIVGEKWEHYWIAFNGRKVEHILNQINLKPLNQIFDFRNNDIVKYTLLSFINNAKEAVTDQLYIISALFYILSCIIYKRDDANIINKTDQYVKDALIYIQTNYYRDISIKSIANYINISEKYFHHIFKNKIGISPQSYLINTRLDYAERLMKTTDLKICEIAYSVGYQNAFNFSQIYKKYKGITPTEFKNRL